MEIGLLVVKHIIGTQGWKIDGRLKKNAGSSFTVTIPYTSQEMLN